MARRPDNIFLALFSAVIMVAGLVAVGCGLYIYIAANKECLRGIQNPLLITGGAFVVLSLLGVIGSYTRNNWYLACYYVVMFVVVLGLLGLTIFGILVTNRKIGEGAHTLFNKGTDLRYWVRHHFVDGDENWERIKNCLLSNHMCSSIRGSGITSWSEIYKKHLPPTQMGCCLPPNSCGFVPKNATYWLPPDGGAAAAGEDCKKWSNERGRLCFSCESCKDGFTSAIKKKWRALAIVNLCFDILCIILYILACFARRNNRHKDKYYAQ